MQSAKRLALIAGVLYRLVGVFGGFAQGFVAPQMYVAGDASATAGNLVENAGLVRVGVVADLINATLLLFLALTLYILLKHVHKSAARAMLVLAAIATAIACVSAVFLFEGMQVATGAVDLTALGTEGSDGLVLLLLDIKHYALLAAQIFFGLWLAPLGYLAYRSGWFTKALGILLIVATACYLVDVLSAFLVPDFNSTTHRFIIVPVAIAEIWMVVYLLVIGVKPGTTHEPALAAG